MNYLQLNTKGKFASEEQKLVEYFGEGNYIPFYGKHFLQNKIKLTKNDFIAGTIPIMFNAMKRLGIEYSHNDYPDILKPYLHRRIWESKLGYIMDKVFNEELLNPIFIKPADKLKRFTGFLLNNHDDWYLTEGAGYSTKIICSDAVQFLSEYRCPVIHGKIQGAFYYYDDNDKEINLDKVQEMANAWDNLPKAYVLDVGLLSTGETALIEVNDAFSLGSYDMSNELYGKLLTTRWNELLGV